MMADRVAVRSKVIETIEKARMVYGKDIPMPNIKFSNRMTTTAGKWQRKNYQYNVVFSLPIMDNNDTHAFCEDTVIHEIAHHVDYIAHGSTGHNQRFYGVMRMLGHKNPTRCHSFEVQRRKTKTHKYVCRGCGQIMELSTVRHNRVLRGVRYKHNACGGGLVFAG